MILSKTEKGALPFGKAPQTVDKLRQPKSIVLKQAAPLRSVVSILSEAEVAKLDERTRMSAQA